MSDLLKSLPLDLKELDFRNSNVPYFSKPFNIVDNLHTVLPKDIDNFVKTSKYEKQKLNFT